MERNDQNKLVMVRLSQFADAPSFDCPCCSSSEGQWRGYRARKDGSVFHRKKCGECGRWYYGTAHVPIEAMSDEEKARDLEKEREFDAWLEAYESKSEPIHSDSLGQHVASLEPLSQGSREPEVEQK